MMRTGKAPTISDVAREAGVSPFTVSVVLNGARSNTRVSEATRQRIMSSASALRYQPNASARNLARQRTAAVGVLFDVIQSTTALSNDYASAILEGIVAQAASREYDVMLYTASWRDSAHSASRFGDRRTDGIVVVAPLTDSDVLDGLAAIGTLPLVAVSASPSQSQASGVSSVDVDNAKGIELAVDHLLSLGHRRIAHLKGNENVFSANARCDSFVHCMAHAGITTPAEYIVSAAYDAKLVPAALTSLLALPEPPTAIVAGNDNIAVAAQQTAQSLGLSIPADLSIVGFDNIPLASLLTPGLTTIAQPLRAIGVAALDLLIERIDRAAKERAAAETAHAASVAQYRLLTPELIVRGSTGPAPLTRKSFLK